MTAQRLTDPFGARAALGGGNYLYRLAQLEKIGVVSNLARLPFSIRILLEAALRNCDGFLVTQDDVKRLAAWDAKNPAPVEIPFMPARVIMQDFTGVPCVVDLAAMRDAVKRLGKNAKKINPLVPVDLVIDHSVLVDFFGSKDALQKNAELEFERNRERYEFLRWGSQAFENLRVVPPATGIVHQVNLEYLAQGVLVRPFDSAQGGVVYPDTVVGTDSHTTMINGLGVLGWGVGGIEAEAVMLGQPYYMVMPEVVGFKFTGALREGVTATDLTLTVTQILRKKGVVDKFVEFYGPGLSAISLADRATIGNMAPDYGATMGFFPTDAETLRYLRASGRAQSADLLERYAKEQGLFRTDASLDPIFSDTIELNLAEVEPSLAGPKNPEERVAVRDLKSLMRKTLVAPVKEGGYGLDEKSLTPNLHAERPITHGAVVLAGITSCTNTSNPSVMLGAGLLAKKAVEAGLAVKPHVKTSLAPGSKVVTEYLNKTGLTPYLEKLGFFTTGYGCTVCIGNSGPLPDAVSKAINDGNLVAAAVISGNRNFEGRVHAQIRANFLASPPLVVAYALAGTTDINLDAEPLGTGKDGKPVFLRDVWPTQKEIADAMQTIDSEMFTKTYANVFDGNPMWNAIPVSGGEAFAWNKFSTYIQEPPFFLELKPDLEPVREIRNARILGLFGDRITTDHISPAGGIAKNSPAADYLEAHDVAPQDFNQYGTRRGNHEVMMRGTFANIRLKNLILGGEEGGNTLHFPDGTKMAMYDAAMKYKTEGVPLVVIAGKAYGTGSSRDWAAKGAALLGIRAVITQSFERIHRGNLVGMGVLPLQFKSGESAATYNLTGREVISILGVSDSIKPRQEVRVEAQREDGTTVAFNVIARLDTPVEVEYYKNGGILQTVLRNLMKA